MRTLTLFSLILFLIFFLSLLGLIFIFAASNVWALELSYSSYHYIIKQFYGLLLGIICACIASRFSSAFMRKLAPLLFLVNLLLVCATLIPSFSIPIHGSRRWLNLGFLSFQPSEFLKMASLLYCAHLLTKHQHTIRTFSFFMSYSSILISAAAILLLQPDFGQALTLLIMCALMYFIAGGNLHYLYISGLSALPLVSLLIYMKAYRLKRILTFINPWAEPEGSGFQIIQSLVAIGSGCLTGSGLGQSKQKFFYLPMIHTDFIFSIIAEEIGFIGSLALLVLYFLCIMGGFKIALLIEDLYTRLVVIGYFSLIGLEMCINIGVATALLPTKGLSLPFISYGKSSLITHIGMLGVLYALIKET